MIDIITLMLLYIGVGLPVYILLSGERSNWQKVLGDSFFLGVFIIVVFLNVVQFLQIDADMSLVVKCFGIFAMTSWLVVLYLKRKLFVIPSFNGVTSQAHIFYVFALALIGLHLYHIIVQNTSMPLIGWDAWNGWVAKAKIWYYHGVSEPLVNRFAWLQSDSALTNSIVHYPDGLSLLYLFNSGYLGWNETVLNSIYPSMFIAFLLAFYGNIKILTQSRNCAWIAVVMLVSIPIINIHIALGGYADIWVAAFLMLSVFNAQLFLNKPNVKIFISMAIFATTMVMFKLESWVWLSIFTSVFVLSLLSKKRRIILYVLFISICTLWLLNGGFSLSLPFGDLIITPSLIQIPALGSYSLTFLNTTDSLVEALFLSKSWGILWYLVPVVFLLPIKIKDKTLLVLPGLFLLFTILFLFVLFYLSYASNFANDFTSSNRIVLHVVPLYIYLMLQVVNQYRLQNSKIE